MHACRALVTGGCGFIGLRLVERLLAEGSSVTILDNLTRVTKDEQLEKIQHRARFVRWDLTRPEPPPIPDDVEWVFHLAAHVGVAHTMRAPYRVLRDNLLSTMRLLDSLPDSVNTICFASSSEVYGWTPRLPLPTPESVPLTIPDPALPRLAYAISKLTGEALFAHQVTRGTRVRIVRYHNVYGPRMGHDHVVPQFIDRLLARTDPFHVYGDQRRAFCFVDDAVRATTAVMAVDEPTATVHIGDPSGETSILDLLERLINLVGFRPSEILISDPPHGSPERRVPDISGLQALTGFEPSVPLERGLDATVRWYAKEERLARLGFA